MPGNWACSATLCWDFGFGYCVDAHCQLPLPKFCIYLVLMPALFGYTSPLRIFCITALGYVETFGFIYIRSAFSRPTHLTMSCCHFSFTAAIQKGQGTPCIAGRKWDTNPLSFHPDLSTYLGIFLVQQSWDCSQGYWDIRFLLRF